MSIVFKNTNKSNGCFINISETISIDESLVASSINRMWHSSHVLHNEFVEVLNNSYFLYFKTHNMVRWFSNYDSMLKNILDEGYQSSENVLLEPTEPFIQGCAKEPKNCNKKEKVIFQLSENVELEVDCIHIRKTYKYDKGNIYILKATSELPMLVLVQLEDEEKYPKFYNDLHSAKMHYDRLLGYPIIELSEVGYTPNNYKELVSLTGLDPVKFRNTFSIAESTFSQHQSGSRGLNWKGWDDLVDEVRKYLASNISYQKTLFSLNYEKSDTQATNSNQRYFYILWKLNDCISNQTHDILHITKNGKFFNSDYVFKGFRKDTSNIQVIDWKEFKNREDYEDFSKDYKEYWSDLNNKPPSQCSF